jgi:hypothetical protein
LDPLGKPIEEPIDPSGSQSIACIGAAPASTVSANTWR